MCGGQFPLRTIGVGGDVGGVAQIGLGDIDDARMKKGIDILVDANQLPRTPAVSEIFVRDFLPPKSERPTKLIDAKG